MNFLIDKKDTNPILNAAPHDNHNMKISIVNIKLPVNHGGLTNKMV